MKTFTQFLNELNEMFSVSIGRHPATGDHIYAPADTTRNKRKLAQVESGTVSFPHPNPPGAPGSLVSDHEHGESHMRKLGTELSVRDRDVFLEMLDSNAEPNAALKTGASPEKVLHIMRGISGSGKSTVARELAESNKDSVILSTDRFFMDKGTYKFDPSKIAEHHTQNIKDAHDHMENGTSNVIIDNTNLVHSHMTPYVAAAQMHGYTVRFHDIHENDPKNINVNQASERMTKRAQDIPGSDHGSEVARRQAEGYEPFKTDDPVKEIMSHMNPEA